MSGHRTFHHPPRFPTLLQDENLVCELELELELELKCFQSSQLAELDIVQILVFCLSVERDWDL